MKSCRTKHKYRRYYMDDEVGFEDMWLNFARRDDFFMRHGLHLTGKGAAVLGCEFVRVVDEGTGTVNYLN